MPITDFDYALVTTIENMHATKPNREYYEEILTVIDCAPEVALMVGDSWKNDIVPATAVGLYTYWIPPDADPAPDASVPHGSGTLADLLAQVQDGWLASLQ